MDYKDWILVGMGTILGLVYIFTLVMEKDVKRLEAENAEACNKREA